MARPRSAGYDDQREQILSAAAALFANRGYTAATMNDVAAACGVSKATLYHYVRDKHDLLAQITAGHVARLEALVADVQARALATVSCSTRWSLIWVSRAWLSLVRPSCCPRCGRR